MTDGSELVDTWILHTGTDEQSAMSIDFKSTGKFDMIRFDGSEATGSYEVQDPLVLWYLDIPAGLTYCSPMAVFSDSDNTMTFSVWDPTACAAADGTAAGTDIEPSPVSGLYDHQ